MQIERIARFALAGLSVVLTVASASGARAACGDGAIEAPTELCDDGNTVTGDGCNENCQTEAGFLCTGVPSLCCFAESSSSFVRRGNASLDTATGEVTLVPDLNNQTGVVWFRGALDFTNPFTVDLRLFLGTRDDAPMSNAMDSGADGGSVLFQRDPRGLNAIGSFGGELGAEGIAPVFGVEFDTYNNDLPYNDVTMGDEDHVSVFHTRTTPMSNHLTPPTCLNNGLVCENYEDGKYHRFAVEWTGNTDRHLKVYVDGVLRVDVAHDFVGDYFGGDPKGIYFGFAASTGASKNLHKFCPAAPVGFTVPRDRDGDGVDDSIDLDDDNDGRSDADETNDVFTGGDPGDDHDRDGVPNYRDPQYWTAVLNRPNDCPDVVAPIGACDRLPTSVDFDNDSMPDHLDHDSDGDTLTDAREDYDGDANGDGLFDACTPLNADGTCPGTRPAPFDRDGDGAIDSRDVDSDNDGSSDQSDPDRDDPCVPDPNAVWCPSGDADQDGVNNGVECPNPRQCPDSNGDGTPDVQDPDQDDDGVFDGTDPAPRDPCIPNNTLAACGSGDSDGDGTMNQTDPAPRDPCIPNANVIACPTGDRDGDGLPNGFECPGGTNCMDTDGDGRPDVDDADSDGDGIDDKEECANPPACTTDSDGDGVPDWRDPKPEIAGGACSAASNTRHDNLGGLLFVALALALSRRRRAPLSAPSRGRTGSSARSA